MPTNSRTQQLRSNRSRFLLLFTILLFSVSQVFGGSAQTADQTMAGSYFQAIRVGSSFPLLSIGSVLHTPEGDFVGIDGPAKFGAVLEASFTDLQFSTQSVESRDNLVIVDFTLTGINSGSYHGVAANCAGIAVPGVAVLQVSDAGVVRQWIGYNSDTVADQIADFNALDPNTRPGCADHVPARISISLDPAPQCRSAKECHLPY